MTQAPTSHPAAATRLADLTTLRVGGAAERLVDARSEAELVEAVRAADDAGEPVLVVGGGSNLLVGDDGVPGVVLRVRTTGIEVEDVFACAGTTVRVAAGHNWDDLVAHAVGSGWRGLEAMSGIPGSTGATPIQNVGAYGQEVAQTVAAVRTWDRTEHRVRTFAAADCGFGYRRSRFKAEPGRFVVLSVTFQLALSDLSTPIAYAELGRALGVEPGRRAPLARVREAVLALRSRKGMVLDDADHDTWSAGSFFTNPVVADPAMLPDGAPRFPVASTGDGPQPVKTSAAWLIEHAGFSRGHGLPGPAALSTKHTLALTNRGHATAEDLLALARQVRDGVRDRFGIELVNEPVLVGCRL